jgi:methylglyoxal synthase
LVVEGRLRMNTVARADGVKEKKVEFTLARIHPLGASPATPQVAAVAPVATVANKPPAAAAKASPSVQPTSWNTGPLVDLPEDEIPF